MTNPHPCNLQSASRTVRDVVVIGGGPAGLRLAYRLACEGYQTVVFDDRPKIGKHKICTGIISPEAFDRFRLPRESILNDIRKLKFFSPQGAELEYVPPSLLAHVVDRTAFDESLAEMASRRGVEIRAGKRVNGLVVSANCVEVEAASVDTPRRSECVRARIVVIATGVNFKLNKLVGLGYPRDFLNAAQAHIGIRNLDCTLCYVGRDIAPGAFAWVVPLGEEKGRVGLMGDGRADYYFKKLLDRIAGYRKVELKT